jgi:hypothetical protein
VNTLRVLLLRMRQQDACPQASPPPPTHRSSCRILLYSTGPTATHEQEVLGRTLVIPLTEYEPHKTFSTVIRCRENIFIGKEWCLLGCYAVKTSNLIFIGVSLETEEGTYTRVELGCMKHTVQMGSGTTSCVLSVTMSGSCLQ